MAPEPVARFADRRDAGRRLAARLEGVRGEDPVVVGVPRGGVPVAHAVAVCLAAPLDVIVVQKLGLPHQPEVGYGALSEDGSVVVDDRIVDRGGLTSREMRRVEHNARHDLLRHAARLRGVRPRLSLLDRTVVIVDDGIVTGVTMRAACRDARARGARRIVVAVPVADPYAFPLPDADEVVCLAAPTHPDALGRWYHRFEQVTDEDVIDYLHRAARHLPYPAPPFDVDEPPPLRDESVRVETADVAVFAQLTVPANPIGAVVFVLACADGRFSPRNRYIAGRLNRARLATMSADLLTPEEQLRRRHVFGIDTLTRRLVSTTRWVTAQREVAGLPVGYFGADTGAAAALRASTDSAMRIGAIVCRAGRPDLTGPAIAEVRAPTLFIVGGIDHGLLEANRRAAREMSCETQVRVVPDASRRCAEPEDLTQVADYAEEWLVDKLTAESAAIATDRRADRR
ncbi:phosphoribosyltransferase family protein [Nocardia arizonensis]|uniref:phosphoribosyltransferase family protein n=1 Tax=Nocardia arizonensis TaxID=1141647 RepID=UPI0006D1BD6C|nr:phosphoribosyltransferase family protein [Nocardia arizonensis]